MASKLACAFGGQGLQKIGMAAPLQHTGAWEYFTEASDILGYDLGKLCLAGPSEKLDNTLYAQPAIFVTTFALWSLVRSRFPADYFLGHSLGEIIALAAAGAFSFAQGVRLVQLRARCMAEHCGAGGMVAVLGLDLDSVRELCSGLEPAKAAYIANENSPTQTVISGTEAGLKEIERLALEFGARRTIRLAVSGPFHSPLLAQAARAFAKAIEGFQFSACRVPVVCNDGETLIVDPAQIKAKLIEQITGPVRFTASVKKLVEMNVKEFVEIGPSGVLNPLARRIEPDLNFTLVTDGGI